MYEFVARAIAVYLRFGNRAASVYAVGSLATGEVLPAISDLDLAVVVPAHGARGAARLALQRRRDQLWRLLPPLGRLGGIGVCEERELAQAQTVCLVQPSEGLDATTLFFGSDPLADELGLTTRPGFPGRIQTWRLLAGAERRCLLEVRSREEDRVAAWLELQSWWLWATQGCLDPTTPGRASLCVKLVAEACRVLLWLENRVECGTRRSVLEHALELLPDERDAVAAAVELQGRLSRSPGPPFERFLPVFLRLTQRIARLLSQELESYAWVPVRLVWGGANELALSGENRDRLYGFVGRELPLLPLVDWRSVVAPTLPDEVFARGMGDAGDPAVLAAAARAGSAVAYVGLRSEDVLVLPPSDVYWLGKHRCVHFHASDPVSFALLEGASVARFPGHPGWSLGDLVARAIVEHRGYLDVQLHQPGWEVAKLGCILSAARAAVVAESLADGEPLIPLTMVATAHELGERHPESHALFEDSATTYQICRAEGRSPPLDPLLTVLSRAVAILPPYRMRDFRTTIQRRHKKHISAT